MSADPKDCTACQGVRAITPLGVANAPGRTALAYRVATYADVFASLRARVTGLAPPAGAAGSPLAALKTRTLDDPAIALLDAWAVVTDVLTFYQERIANEGYLATAQEERSLTELAMLVGYTPRPGVAASVDLAFELDPGARRLIPAFQSAKSVPKPKELPQTFETSVALEARTEWNLLPPLKSLVQELRATSDPEAAHAPAADSAQDVERIVYFKGLTANLQPNDPILFRYDTPASDLWRVKEAAPDPTAGVTVARIERWRRPPPPTRTRNSPWTSTRSGNPGTASSPTPAARSSGSSATWGPPATSSHRSTRNTTQAARTPHTFTFPADAWKVVTQNH
jgi:hypothetical protein